MQAASMKEAKTSKGIWWSEVGIALVILALGSVSMDWLYLGLSLLVLIIVVVWLNVLEHRKRCSMTKEERDAEDEEYKKTGGL